MNGVILSLMLSYSLSTFGTMSQVPVQGEMAGGYHVGPVYALVDMQTWAFQLNFQAYKPLSIRYDFRAGVKFKGFDIYLSRYCQHDVDGGSPLYPENMGLALVVKWSTWE